MTMSLMCIQVFEANNEILSDITDMNPAVSLWRYDMFASPLWHNMEYAM